MEKNLECIRGEESSAIYEFLKANFFPHEPVTTGKDPPGEDEVDFLDQGLSVKAVDSCGRILGVVLNSGSQSDEKPRSTTMKQLVEFFEYCYRQAGLNDTINGYLNLNIIAVQEAARGQGLGKNLVKATEEVAKNAGFLGLYSLATSEFTSKILTSLGWTMVGEISYSDYRDSEGNGILTTVSPFHTHARLAIHDHSSVITPLPHRTWEIVEDEVKRHDWISNHSKIHQFGTNSNQAN